MLDAMELGQVPRKAMDLCQDPQWFVVELPQVLHEVPWNWPGSMLGVMELGQVPLNLEWNLARFRLKSSGT